jgi:acetyl/propionyl-CoA carboxylase alpha subunit
MGKAAVRIAREIGYTNAGTIEFLVDREMNFYFLEMNTRIQVEHPVTEMVTGTDLVEEQILVAEGQPLRLKQETLKQTGHAIECRIYAEDPENNFMPSPGKMTLYKEPFMDHIRIDKGIHAGTEITSSYDPMICKLVSWGNDREEARERMTEALKEYVIHGIRTNIPYLSRLIASHAFITNSISTKFCDEHTPEIIAEMLRDHDRVPIHLPLIGFLLFSLGIRNEDQTANGIPANLWNMTGFWRELMKIMIKSGGQEYTIGIPFSRDPGYTFFIGDENFTIEKMHAETTGLTFSLNGISYPVYVSLDKNENGFVSFEGHIFEMQRHDFLPESESPVRFESPGSHSNEVYSPMPGKVTKLFVNEGGKVKKGDVLLIIEAMKMENSILSPADGTVGAINVALNDRVDPGKALIILEKNEDQDKK